MKRLLGLLMVLALLSGITDGAARALNDGRVTVSLRVEGLSECLYFNEFCDLKTNDGSNSAAGFIASMNNAEDFPTVTIVYREDGSRITDIDGLASGSHGESSGWFFMINGEISDASLSDTELIGGDELVIFFADLNDAELWVPVVDSSRLLTDGILRVTSSGGVPVVGATVEYDKAPMITDENGEIAVPQYNMLAGAHYLQIEQYGETGVPLIIRRAPDYMMFVPYTDMNSGAWYAEAVEYCVLSRLFNGVGDNRFAPDEKMTMVQLIMLLCRIAGGDTTPPPGELWYAAALTWARESGIIPDISFQPDAKVTREIFIYMFYKTAELDGKTDMNKRAVISAASDFSEISWRYVAAIEWAVASGLIIGVGDNDEGLSIDPSGLVSRAVACQMLMRYYS